MLLGGKKSIQHNNPKKSNHNDHVAMLEYRQPSRVRMGKNFIVHLVSSAWFRVLLVTQPERNQYSIEIN